MLFESEAAPGDPASDVEETANDLTAMDHGIESVRAGRLPVSSRLLREARGLLLTGVRSNDEGPGNARFVPPPHHLVPDAMPARRSSGTSGSCR